MSGATGSVDSLLIIQPPFTIEFDITKNIATSANVCQIRIFNLSSDNRNKLRFDLMNGQYLGQYRGVQLRAGYSPNPPVNLATGVFQISPQQFQSGYGTNLPIIFQGNVNRAWSVREGVNFITTIECYDGGYAFNTGMTNIPVNGGIPLKDVITNLASTLPNVGLGVIGNTYGGNVPRGQSLSGNTWDLLKEQTGESCFVNNETVFCLGNNECLEGSVPIINSQTGLLGTPMLELFTLTFDVLFDPRLFPGQIIQLQSSTDANFNGFYKINSIKHRGTISTAVCGDAITSLGMFRGLGDDLITVGSIL